MKALRDLDWPEFHASSDIWGRAMAGHFLEADTDKGDVQSMTRHEKQYGNPLTDYTLLLIAEVKSRGQADLPLFSSAGASTGTVGPRFDVGAFDSHTPVLASN